MSRPIDHEERTGSLIGPSNLDIESPPEHANIGLHTADQRGDLNEVCRILLNQSNWLCYKKWLMTRKDENGMCPIHVAAKEGRHEIIKEFVQVMPNCVNIRGKDYKTALHFAVEHGQLEVVKVLLADKNAKIGRKMVSHAYDKDGNTALHLAAIHAVEPQIVRELLKWPGASVNALNNDGLSALDIAAHSSTIASQRDRRIKSGKVKKILAAVADGGRYSAHSEKKENKIVDVDTVVASLIATTTFAAIFQIPGGMEYENKSSPMYGGAKYALAPAFRWFSILNTLALFTSLTVVIMWLMRERLKNELDYAFRSKVAGASAICLGVSVVSTGLAFLSAYLVIIPPEDGDRLSNRENYLLNLMFFSVLGAAGFVPGIAWTTFLITAVYKFSKFMFTRKPRKQTVRLFPKSVLCTWFAISVVVIGCIIYMFHWLRNHP
uniref:TSA: Wollemia nobilis Ref_Wollemi_Transcript_4210_1690 transcribed RNA sequence n=1 Tax=Wollemia nobilis TaxID=56998 RepID=A0A0C9QWH5_9CONI